MMGSKSALDESRETNASCPVIDTLEEFPPTLGSNFSFSPGAVPETGCGTPARSSANSVIILIVF